MSDLGFKSVFDYKVLYIFTVNDEAHKGLLKIGDATVHTKETPDKLPANCKALNQAALARIRAYTKTLGANPILLHTELAIRTVKKDGAVSIEGFRDYQVHRVLENSGIKHETLGSSREWFKIDLSTALSAIDAVKTGFHNLSHTPGKVFTPIIFRPEQAEAIERTVKHFKASDTMLWNAKMRFGKTTCALQVVKQMKFGKTIIATHRPVVDAGWYDDFEKIFYGTEDYIYGSKSRGYSCQELLDSGLNFVYFASIQDLRGSEMVGGKFSKNAEVFNTDWDCVIVDEAHEGTQTALGDDVIKKLVASSEGHKTKFLALSGTPFNIIGDYNEESIYTWDYIQEQESKALWDIQHFGDHNPYDDLPELKIYTYDLGELVKEQGYISFEDKAFNFREFFRTYRGSFKEDYCDMPPGAKIGDFVHENDVWSFLNLMTKSDDKSSYPYSNAEYRDLFRHSLWMVPGVKEAAALKNLMLQHPTFGSGQFDIVNVAGEGDEERGDALEAVKKAIEQADANGGYTITLSCGKLTTGVTVREWTAVFMLAGSFSTSAANYLQTIFRVQSPCSKDGKVKETAYVFDFAPDRTLKVVASAVKVSSRAGKAGTKDEIILGKFLNYCPVISISGSEMKEYSASILMQQLKKAYAERVVSSGFDDTYLYNDEMLKMDDLDLKAFADLQKLIGKTKAQERTKEIDVNKQGLTQEEYEELERIKKKPKKELTEEELARKKELDEAKKNRSNAISILRGISIRMPLLIYGMDVDFNDEITIQDLVEKVDDSSWDEFMPVGVTKDLFKTFIKYYDADIFIAAGRRIRNLAKAADDVDPTERVKKIAMLFSNFKNPDKETVLTPWRVVNMHMSDTLGGYDFYDEKHLNMLDEPRFIDQGDVTANTFGKEEPCILEINSKTGLYPLYVAYSVYRSKLEMFGGNDAVELSEKKALWNMVVGDNLFVICKTPMAKLITKRTLVGYSDASINAHYFDDLINALKSKPQQFIEKVTKKSYWKKGNGKMEFDAIVGNPPYQVMDNGAGASASPVYQYFVESAKKIEPNYVSMVTPSRWFAGGKGLDSFRANMLSDTHLRKLVDYVDSRSCFPNVALPGGVSYFLWDKKHDGLCTVSTVRGTNVDTMDRKMNEYDIFIRNNASIKLIKRVEASADSKMDEVVSARNVFGISSNIRGVEVKDEAHPISLFSSWNSNNMTETFVSEDVAEKGQEFIHKYKVIIGKVVPRGGEVGVAPSVGYRVISTIQVLNNHSVFTDTYLLLSAFDTKEEAINFAKYMCCKFPRFLLHETYSSMNIVRSNFRFVPYLDYSREWTDKELYQRYNCSEEEINMIDSMIRPMEYVVHE